jgi:hypothetical protein
MQDAGAAVGPLSHAVSRGSIPLGVTKKIQGVSLKKLTPFSFVGLPCWAFYFRTAFRTL